MGLCKILQVFSFCKTKCPLIPKWFFGEKNKQENKKQQTHKLLCVSMTNIFHLHYLFTVCFLQQNHNDPQGNVSFILSRESTFMPYHCYFKRGCLLSSGEQFSCITLPVAASRCIFILRKSCCWCFVDKKIRSVFTNI